MNIAPQLCAKCALAGVVATERGPTCTHQMNSGVLWWPAWWNDRGVELRRLQWLDKNKDKPEGKL